MSFNSIKINNSDTSYTHSIFDISEYTGRQYSNLNSALADVPTEKQSGGMTVRYISDNKYIQYRLTASEYSNVISDWEIMNDTILDACIIGNNLFTNRRKYLNSIGEIKSIPSDIHRITPYIPVILNDSFYLELSGGQSHYSIFDNSYNILEYGRVEYLVNNLLIISNVNAKFVVFYNDFEAYPDAIVEKQPSQTTLLANKDKSIFNKTIENKVLYYSKYHLSNDYESGYFRNSFLLTISDFELIKIGAFIRQDKSYATDEKFRVYKITLPEESKIYFLDLLNAVTFLAGFYTTSIGGDFIQIDKVDGSEDPVFILNQTLKLPIREIYLNIDTAEAEDPLIRLSSPLSSYIDEEGKEHLDLSNIIYLHTYIGDQGQQVQFTGTYVAKIPYDRNYDYYFPKTSVVGGCYDENDNWLGNITAFCGYYSGEIVTQDFPLATRYFLFTSPRDVYRVPKQIKRFEITEYLQRPFNFQNKSAVFFGDSITDGFISVPGSSQYRDRNKAWPKLLCDKVGMTCSNQGIGGSALTFSSSQYTSGVELICGTTKKYTITEDYIFIAHGSNDWSGHIPIGMPSDSPSDYTQATTFYGALNLVCSTIKTEYPNKQVIFVLPIWRKRNGGAVELGTNPYELDIYRRAICDVAFKNNFNVIDGGKFGFDCGSDLTIADGVHPTELGYQIYAQQVYNRLI